MTNSAYHSTGGTRCTTVSSSTRQTNKSLKSKRTSGSRRARRSLKKRTNTNVNICGSKEKNQYNFSNPLSHITHSGTGLSRGSLLSRYTRWSNHSLLTRRTSRTRVTTGTTGAILARGTSKTWRSNYTLKKK